MVLYVIIHIALIHFPMNFCRVSRIRTYGEQPLEVHTGVQDQPLKPTRALPVFIRVPNVPIF